MYTINNLPKYLVLGNQGEKNVTSFQFDVTPWLVEYPTGTIAISILRPGEDLSKAYPAIQTSLDEIPVEGGELGEIKYILTWIVDDVDTEIAGRGQLSLYLSTPEVTNIKKSPIITIAVIGNISPTGTPTNALTQWLAQSTNMLNTLNDAYDTMEFLHVKFAMAEPQADEDMNDIVGPWIGVYRGTSHDAPTDYTAYVWNRITGIQSIERTTGTGAPGTTDTYTITYTDGLTTNYDVVQGNGIASIVRTTGDGTEGTIDTYTITYDNGTTSTFDVQNGEDSYIHIKYSETASPTDAQMTNDSNNRYMGVCVDQDAEAPTTSSSYNWTQIRGNSFVPSFYIDENSNLHLTVEPEYDGPESSGIVAPTQNALYLGQIYVDTVTLTGYLAVQLGTGATDWKQIT